MEVKYLFGDLTSSTRCSKRDFGVDVFVDVEVEADICTQKDSVTGLTCPDDSLLKSATELIRGIQFTVMLSRASRRI